MWFLLAHKCPRFLCHLAKIGRRITCETEATSMNLNKCFALYILEIFKLERCTSYLIS